MDLKKLRLLVFIGVLFMTSVAKCDNAEADESDDNEEAPTSVDDEKSTPTNEDGVEEDNGILILTKDNFDDVVYSKDSMLVEFYAPWCGHCKQLEPEYAKAAKVLRKQDPPIYLAKVDATVDSDLASRFEVTGYPTIKFFKKGEAYEYDDARTAEGLIRFVKERADPNWKPPPSAVVDLKTDTFKEFVDNTELALVEFYAPWCGHCKQMAPTYEKAAKRLQMNTPAIPLAKVDATVETELASQYEVTGYPTMKIFRKGRAFTYNGPRDEHGMVNYMTAQQGEASRLRVSSSEIKKYLKKDDITIIGFFESLEDIQLRTYMDAANELRDDYTFGHSLSKEARDHFKVNPNSVVVFNAERFYTKFEPKWHILSSGDYSIDDVTAFVKTHRNPLVGHYNLDTQQKRYNEVRPLCLVFYTVDWSFDHREATQLWRRKVAAIAAKNKGITFAVADEEDNQDLMVQFGLSDSSEELNIGCYGNDGKRYKMEPLEEWDSDDVQEFLEKLMKGKLKPEIRSQPIPKRQDGPVKVVVAKTFDDIVKDKSKDVLIEMYAPWCGHCKHLEPVYKSLAKKYKNDKKLVIAKMDATVNDLPDNYKAEGFPTIYYAPSNNKETPLKFEGGRTLEDFEKYLKEHATVSFKTKDEL